MRALLCLVLVGCGSSSSSASSASLEADLAEGTGEEVLSAPLDAGPERDCSCVTVEVRCRVEGPFHARADRAGCTLELPPASCALLGLEDGAAIDPLSILARPVPAAVGPREVYEVCTAMHEARHACDGPSVSACASEVAAYAVTLECMRPFAGDGWVAHNIEGSMAAAEMNACLCGASSCEECHARCTADHPAFARSCEQARALYCR